MRKIALLNFKGGTGKTTTAVNLSHALALKHQRVKEFYCQDIETSKSLNVKTSRHQKALGKPLLRGCGAECDKVSPMSRTRAMS